MIEIRPYASLGHADPGWLNARHHFSFSNYRDRNRMGWGSLRVWNDDEIAGNAGFPTHPHADMEIITYVRTGAITHQDSLGNRGRTVAGDVQVMSAGTGIEHAEYNAEPIPTTLFQLWILPDARGGKPSWGAKLFPKADRAGKFIVLASGKAEDMDALPIRADARVLGATLKSGQSDDYHLGKGRKAYIVPAVGSIEVNGVSASTGDGIAIEDEEMLVITALNDAEIIMVDVT